MASNSSSHRPMSQLYKDRSQSKKMVPFCSSPKLLEDTQMCRKNWDRCVETNEKGECVYTGKFLCKLL